MVVNKKQNDEQDVKLSIAKIFVDYLKTTHPIHLFVHMIYIAVICSILSLSYVVTFHIDDLFVMYNNVNNQTAADDTVEIDVESSSEVNRKLETLLTDLGAMRAYVYKYHGKLDTITGVPFFYQSNIFEVISPGTSRLMEYEQRIPTGIHMSMNSEFVRDRCVLIKNTTSDTASQNYYYYTSRNAAALERCPIFLTNGDLFGYVGVDWANTVEDNTLPNVKLHETATELGEIFSRLLLE